ncbi:MAG: DUF624 domain-containing protein [Clostridium butyricum]|nr:DUF624 domain-containing protein [Clostridium butyricum]
MRNFLIPDYSRPGPGIDRNAPKKTGIPLLFETFCREFTTLLKLNFIFLICCIPIITIGPAIAGMTNVTLKMVKDEPSDLLYDFKEGFKKNFKQGLILGGIGAISVFLILCAFLFYMQFTGSTYYLMMLIVSSVAMFFFMGYMYMFPMAVSVNLNIRAIIKNSFILAFVSFKKSFITVAICGLIMIFGFIFRFITIPVILMFFSFSFSSFMTSFYAWERIEKDIIK